MTYTKRVAGAAIFATMLIGLPALSAQAAYIVDLTQQGSDVVATGSGAIDLTGLILEGGNTDLSTMDPMAGVILIGPAGYGNFAFSGYIGVSSGPTRFGSGTGIDANSGGGDAVGINGLYGALLVPVGYVSGSPLTDTATWANQTFNTLGVTPGRYEWTWGSGANQNFTLVIGTPEPSTWAMMLLGFVGLGYAGYHRRQKLAGAVNV